MTRPLTSPGRLVAGRYRLESEIGGGGMGTVWLARDELLGRQVAIKQVLSPATVSPQEADQQRQRALREGRIAARLSHPHAISVYDVALESGQPWLVMEYLPSRSLGAVLAEDGALPVKLVAQIGAQVADALAATHAAGIVHRDVKPANILIGSGGRIEGLVKITDFGISHAAGDVTLTQTGQITGTPAYLAPEVAQGREMTAASDVYSLGATLYTCLEGQPPFGMEENALAMLHRVAGGQIVPPRWSGVLTRPLVAMLAADPDDRPTMAEVRDELATLAAGRGGDTTTVLLARTPLRSDSGRSGTAVFAAEAAATGTPTPAPTPVPAAASATLDGTPAAGAVVAAPEPAVEPVREETRAPVTPPPPPPAGGRGRGRTGLWITVAAVVLLLGGLIAFLTTQGNDPGGASASTGTGRSSSGASSSGASSSGAATSSGTTAQSSTSSQAATTSASSPATSAAAGGDLTAANIRNFLTSYHRLVLSDPHQAYAETGPTLRAAESEANYVNFWGQFSDVRISNIQATDGQSTATATLALIKSDGSNDTGQHRFTFITQNGRLLLDSDRR